MVYDASRGDLARTAIGNWAFDSLSAGGYSIHFSNLDGSAEYLYNVVTDPSRRILQADIHRLL